MKLNGCLQPCQNLLLTVTGNCLLMQQSIICFYVETFQAENPCSFIMNLFICQMLLPTCVATYISMQTHSLHPCVEHNIAEGNNLSQ